MNIRNYLSLFLDANQSKGTVLYCCSTFQHHARFFNNEDHSYPKMSVIWPRACTVVEQHFFLLLTKVIPFITIIMMLFGVENYISQMLDYQQQDKIWVKNNLTNRPCFMASDLFYLYFIGETTKRCTGL